MELQTDKFIMMLGDCLERIKELPDNSIDSCVTDPPYHLTSIVKRFGKANSAPAKHGTDGAFARASKGFMGQEWDGGDIAFRPETWAEVFRVLKPGGHMIAFSGSRTYHRMACAIEDAGFEIRDQIMWLYGSGFPKSHNAGDGWGTALKPSHEPMVLARKPLIGTVAANVMEYGTGAINIDGCRVGDELIKTNGRGTMSGNTAIVPQNPNYEGSKRVGRFPANVMHDGSDEVLQHFPDAKGQQGALRGHDKPRQSPNGIFGAMGPAADCEPRTDISKSAARFFYCPKASKADRGPDNKHPTVKPNDLMRYLCRLITPAGGTVLDPFTGSGSTGKAALMEGFKFIGIERDETFWTTAIGRMADAD